MVKQVLAFGMLAISFALASADFWTAHKEVTEEHLCYQSDYIDSAYEREGYMYGECPSKYNDVLEKTTEKICDGHSDENTKYCPDSVIEIHIEKIGIQGPTTTSVLYVGKHANYHKEVTEEHLCYETDYTDAAYKNQGYVAGKCPLKYNDVLEQTTETICDGHSEENTKYCPDSTVKIHVQKRGIENESSNNLESAPLPGELYHVESKEEHLCYETNYTDPDFENAGWKEGACPKTFNSELDRTEVTICMGHSNENLKYCPKSQLTITVLKMGVTFQVTIEETGPLPGDLYHIESDAEHLCYETNYTDSDFESAGWSDGGCPKQFSELSRTEVTICMGHSSENLKYCPKSQLNITVLKMGVSFLSYSVDPQKYHLGEVTDVTCYETTYNDADMNARGYVVGPCDPSFDNVLSSTTSEVCDGHSNENIKYCKGDTINITIYKIGKKPSWFREAGNLCYTMDYNDDHLTNDEGYSPGICPNIYNDLLDTSTATYCKGHSEENIKYCPGETVTATIKKFGETPAASAAEMRKALRG
eukprot:g1135.t1